MSESQIALAAAQSAAAAATTAAEAAEQAVDASEGVQTARDEAVAAAALFAQTAAWARNPDQLIAGAVTRDANGAATSAPVVWPDGTPGTYTATTVSTAFPGAVDAYTITYGSPATRTYTQPLITRDANGAATNVPAITVA